MITKDAITEAAKIESALVSAHMKALPANWVYTDVLTTIDLLVAECTTLRTELAAACKDTARLDWLLSPTGADVLWNTHGGPITSLNSRTDIDAAMESGHGA